ncbi:phosphatidylglycerophosphate synthase [Catenuloplanes nepalensis]|uniref:Phosphatidylglycerophosphate synthase n=1 Tax=Catenuloplanes nepalensis TaxID=587533 RepID=A0ABT9N632_9ACTN|nr:CDP-alcohol phosphatidyltransferase family protein [Catenuloplanes nepalensis]MDP9798978.1 phosphatidylglycerophosphate synthase [Catenuloplanes nepalensis]
MHSFTTGQVRATLKDRDAWWTVLLVDPLATPAVRRVARYRWVTPNRITFAAFLLGLAAAAAFWQATWGALAVGALLFHLSFVLDCMDGKVARLRGNGSAFGAWLDFIGDRIKDLTCTAGLFGGQWATTGDDRWLALGALVLFINMFRYLNGAQMTKVRADMRERMAAARRAAGLEQDGELRWVEETMDVIPAGEAADGAADINGEFRARYGRFIGLRNALRRYRIRPHLVSGIEFQMFVFIVGPLTNRVAIVTLVTGALLLIFEAGLIYKLWLSTRSFERQMATLRESVTVG